MCALLFSIFRDFLHNIGPLQVTKKAKSAIDTVQEVFSMTEEVSQTVSTSADELEHVPDHSSHNQNISPQSMKKMLELLCDESVR